MCTEEPLGGLTHGAILSDEIQTPIGQLHKSVGGVPAGCVFQGRCSWRLDRRHGQLERER
jgi:hypothetical protein